MRPSTIPSLMWRTASAIATSRLWRTTVANRSSVAANWTRLNELRCSWNHVIDARMPSSIRAHRVGLVADRGLLAASEVLVRAAEQLDEQLFLAGEVPVEDALADVQARHDVRDRGRVVAPLGEQPRRFAHDLEAPVATTLRQLPRHSVTLRAP